VLKEIKLYDVGEEDEMLPDCTESDFQDLENVISKVRCCTALLTIKQIDASILENEISLYLVERLSVLPLDVLQP
jgi:hypothetical protein